MSLTKKLFERAIVPDLSYGVNYGREYDYPEIPVMEFRLKMSRKLLESVDCQHLSPDDLVLLSYAVRGEKYNYQCDYRISGINEFLVDPCIYIWPEKPCSNQCYGPFIVELTSQEQEIIREVLDKYFLRHLGGDCSQMLDKAEERTGRIAYYQEVRQDPEMLEEDESDDE